MGLFSRRRGPSAKAQIEAQARAIIAIGLLAAAIDGELDEREGAEFFRVISRLPTFREIPTDRVKAITKETERNLKKKGPKAVFSKAVADLTPEFREIAYFIAVRVVAADGRIEDSEKDYLTTLAGNLELTKGDCARIIEDATGQRIAGSDPSGPSERPKAPQPEKSETKNTPTFSAYILLSEALQFNTFEIREALMEDFPALEIEGAAQRSPFDMDCDTAELITSPVLMGQDGNDANIATLIRMPGYGTWDVNALETRQKWKVPDLAERMERNASYICVTVGASDKSLTETFRAARLCSCLAAVFARLPVALAVYWETADHFLTPEQGMEMADKAMADDWPVDEWIGIGPSQKASGDITLSEAYTRGLAAFSDFELLHPVAPVSLGEAAAVTMSVATMALEYGHTFTDGDTLGHDGQAKSDSYRIRNVPKAAVDAPWDYLALMHPKSPFDIESVVGPRTPNPPPPGVKAEQRGDAGFFKRMMQRKTVN